jgi:hypothetical protein
MFPPCVQAGPALPFTEVAAALALVRGDKGVIRDEDLSQHHYVRFLRDVPLAAYMERDGNPAVTHQRSSHPGQVPQFPPVNEPESASNPYTNSGPLAQESRVQIRGPFQPDSRFWTHRHGTPIA